MIIHLLGLELPINLIFHLAAFVILQNIAGKIYDRYISQLNNINKLVITLKIITHIYIQINDTFKKTLDVMPNGVLLIDIKTKIISLVSPEMKILIGSPEECEDFNEMNVKI